MAKNDNSKIMSFPFDRTVGKVPQNGYNDNNGGDFAVDIQKYIDRLDQDRKDMEARLTEERRLSEERIEKRSSELEDRMEKRFTEANQRTKEFENRLEQRFASIDQRFDRMENKIEKISGDVFKEGKSTRNWMIGTFFTVAAMVLASIVGLVTIVLQVFPNL